MAQQHRPFLPPHRQYLRTYLALAAVLHFLFLPYVAKFGQQAHIKHHNTPLKQEAITWLDQDLYRPKRNPLPTPLEKNHLTKKDLQKEIIKKEQIVDIAPPKDQQAPKEASFLAEYNSKVARQTQSRQTSHLQPIAPTAQAPEAIVKPTPPLSQQNKQSPQKAAQAANKKSASSTPPTKANWELRLDPKLLFPSEAFFNQKKNKQPLEQAANDAEDTPAVEDSSKATHASHLSDILPPSRVLAQFASAPFMDHLQGIDSAESTFLNAKEFKYASFFNRLKRSISEHWKPLEEYKRRDPTGQIYGLANRMTTIMVVLDAEGRLLENQLIQSSGLDFLDNAALQAFQKAAPFVHPPLGILDEQQQIRFPFSFHLQFH